jgi:hypothetical protein
MDNGSEGCGELNWDELVLGKKAVSTFVANAVFPLLREQPMGQFGRRTR